MAVKSNKKSNYFLNLRQTSFSIPFLPFSVHFEAIVDGEHFLCYYERFLFNAGQFSFANISNKYFSKNANKKNNNSNKTSFRTFELFSRAKLSIVQGVQVHINFCFKVHVSNVTLPKQCKYLYNIWYMVLPSTHDVSCHQGV